METTLIFHLFDNMFGYVNVNIEKNARKVTFFRKCNRRGGLRRFIRRYHVKKNYTYHSKIINLQYQPTSLISFKIWNDTYLRIKFLGIFTTI